ncbi:hypothetical protein CsSME_00015778 [Camellia sinensis var. sinensis]
MGITARSGWRDKTLWSILGIFRRNPSWLRVVTRNASLVLLGVSLDIIPIRSLMLVLGYLTNLEQLVCFDQWNHLNTMLRTTLLLHAGGRGYNIVMTTSLSSDVPVGYFSWSEYDITAPLQPKTEKALAAAFISNCGARNFRLQALEALEEADIKIDSYGSCHRNRDEQWKKSKL